MVARVEAVAVRISLSKVIFAMLGVASRAMQSIVYGAILNYQRFSRLACLSWLYLHLGFHRSIVEFCEGLKGSLPFFFPAFSNCAFIAGGAKKTTRQREKNGPIGYSN